MRTTLDPIREIRRLPSELNASANSATRSFVPTVVNQSAAASSINELAPVIPTALARVQVAMPNPARKELHLRVMGGDVTTRIYIYGRDGTPTTPTAYWPLKNEDCYVLENSGEVWASLGGGTAGTLYAMEYVFETATPQRSQ